MANEHGRTAAAAPYSDYVDDLFDYDVGLDGILEEINTNKGTPNLPKQTTPPDNSGVVLGLDEEVKVSKRRQPVAKLDEDRLLTQAGIPKLRRSAKKNLKFKGKGHEFSDLARLLNFYQLWLDDLFPRAKFADGLAMIERLGHTKRLQTMRRAWIDDDKPKPGDNDTLDPLETSPNGNNATSYDKSGPDITLPTDRMDAGPSHGRSRLPKQLGDMDEYLFIPDDRDQQGTADARGTVREDDDFDELDALLREHEGDSSGGNTV
ncbi:Chromosome segregation in meiosis protein 3 [Aspergillus lucknowensis]|uniref:Chromosome segregation in meiosis protein n=1 Tax=Aspergillus lucknowensis TaxID=176173 RepID=A0ABR4LQL3_9EURO